MVHCGSMIQSHNVRMTNFEWITMANRCSLIVACSQK